MKYACVALLVAVVACTTPNPASCLEDHHCSDPARPYCDANGAVGGVEGACIAVNCTPGKFLVCDGDYASTCTASGDNYEAVECPFGCGTHGCNAPSCPVGTTMMCAGNSLVTCDGDGHATDTQPCALGCNEAAKRCNKVNPSNGFAGSLDDAAGGPDLMLVGAATIDTDLGTVTDTTGARTVLTSAITAGVPVGLFVIKVKSFATGGKVTVVGARGLVIVASGTVSIHHVLSVSARVQLNGPGAMPNDISCYGGAPLAGNANGHAGGGGAGFGTIGGRGGNGGNPTVQGGAAGGVAGTTELVPLRGGCAGGADVTSDSDYTKGAGGGAIQIVSGEMIDLGDGGFVAANGSGGGKYKGPQLVCQVGTPCDHGDGGGSGGAILLEAPVVAVGSLGGIVANGGGGACNVNGLADSGGLSAAPAVGPTCFQDGSKGGDGGAGGIAAQNGGNGTGTTPVGGGGGGGMGRIRVNVLGAFAPAGVVSGVVTTGALGLR